MGEHILVVGGTGMLGEPVARSLAAAGHRVRVLTRRLEQARSTFGGGFEVFEGDVDDPASVERALAGCSGVHLSLDGRGDWDLERRGAQQVATAAARLGVARITTISGASACEENAWFPMTRAKLDAEAAIHASGVPFTVLRCTMFMDLLPKFVRGAKALVMGRQPTPWHWVAAADYARMVVAAYAAPQSANKTLYVYGPEALTFEEALGRYLATCAPHVRLAHVPFWVLAIMSRLPGREELRRAGLPIMRYFSRVREIGDPTEANILLGPPTITLDEWCRERAEDRAAA